MTDRTIRVVEVRFSVDGGPWGDPQPARLTDEPASDWDDAFRHPVFRTQLSQERVVPYVPASELERYRAVVEAAINWNAASGSFAKTMLDVLVAQGFINPDGTRRT